MTIENYIDNINQRYKLGNATEYTFRGDLQNLLETLLPEIRTTKEPKRQSCGAPDYILIKKDIPLGFIEAKDIGDKDLEGKKKSVNKEQYEQYRAKEYNREIIKGGEKKSRVQKNDDGKSRKSPELEEGANQEDGREKEWGRKRRDGRAVNSSRSGKTIKGAPNR